MANIRKQNQLAPLLRTTIMLEVPKEELKEQDVKNIGDYYNLRMGEKLYFSSNPTFRVVKFIAQPLCTCNLISCERDRDGRRAPSWFNLNYLLAKDENLVPIFPEFQMLENIQERVDYLLSTTASVGYFALSSNYSSLSKKNTQNNVPCITPLELFEKHPTLPIKYNTGPEFGKGGFDFHYHRELYNDEIDCYLVIQGKYINPVGPFKKYTEIYIKFVIRPSCNEANDGCICLCKYKSEFRKEYFTSDADKLCVRLINLLSEHFEFQDGKQRISENGEEINLEKYQNISYKSLPFRFY